jgi:hypothetical protein
VPRKLHADTKVQQHHFPPTIAALGQAKQTVSSRFAHTHNCLPSLWLLVRDSCPLQAEQPVFSDSVDVQALILKRVEASA